MKNRILVVLLLLVPFVMGAEEAPVAEPVARVSGECLTPISENLSMVVTKLGTGFFVGDTLVTNKHVITCEGGEEASRVIVTLNMSKNRVWVRMADIVETHEDEDLAYLRIKGVSHKSLELGPSGKVGDPITVVSYPSGHKSVEPLTWEGSIISMNKYNIVDVKVTKGSSGSPVLNEKGQVIGVIWGRVVPEVDDDGFGDGVFVDVEKIVIDKS